MIGKQPKSPQGEGSEHSGVWKLVNKFRQSDNASENDSVKDLVQNLTNLALAITDDRDDSFGMNESETEKKKVVVSKSERPSMPESVEKDQHAQGSRKYERKFDLIVIALERST